MHNSWKMREQEKFPCVKIKPTQLESAVTVALAVDMPLLVTCLARLQASCFKHHQTFIH